MLQNLHVKNLALIEEEEVEFTPGFNVLTGETGAGKSILIGSIHLALGEKAPKDLIREGAEYALVELIFTVTAQHQLEALSALDITVEDGQLILSRKLFASGRSVCRLNDETVSATRMQQVAAILIDIHGQHEHQSLLAKRNHMKYLDAYAKKELAEKKELLAKAYRSYGAIKRELEEASLDTEQQKRELSFLQYEVDEIVAAQLIEGEDEQLEAQFQKLSNGQRILEAAAECATLCSEGRENAADQIGRALRALLSVSGYDPQMEELANQLQEVEDFLDGFNRDFADYINDLDGSEELFLQVQQRLDVINHLKSKYGKTIPIILTQLEEKEAQIEKLLHYEEYLAELTKAAKEKEHALAALCQEVSAIRKASAKALTAELTEALKQLNFHQVQLVIEIETLPQYTAEGTDSVRFLISTNPGEPVKPLDTVASGGELSRIMLALKTVLAENDETETLIFDEIDSGISGRTAQMVAEKMKKTAKNHQVLCITHLPQIAAMADTHFYIEKTAEESSTISRIVALDEGECIQELARMLGGVRITEAVLENAREMKALAETIA